MDQIRTNDHEQNNRKYNLTFRNIQVDQNDDFEKCVNKVIAVCKTLDLDLITKDDFAACHYLPSKKGSASIVARFLNVHNADLVYRARKNTKDMTNFTREELGVPSGKNVTIHPNLTKTNQMLMKQAWKLKDQFYCILEVRVGI